MMTVLVGQTGIHNLCRGRNVERLDQCTIFFDSLCVFAGAAGTKLERAVQSEAY